MSLTRMDVVSAMLADVSQAKYEHRHEVVARHMPKLACQFVGHIDQPRILLGRFARRPWRCARCHHWLVTVKDGDSNGSWWNWEDVTGEVER